MSDIVLKARYIESDIVKKIEGRGFKVFYTKPISQEGIENYVLINLIDITSISDEKHRNFYSANFEIAVWVKYSDRDYIAKTVDKIIHDIIEDTDSSIVNKKIDSIKFFVGEVSNVAVVVINLRVNYYSERRL